MPYYRAVAQAAASTTGRIGVLLVNLGTPDSPSYFSVQRYLREFLTIAGSSTLAPDLAAHPVRHGVAACGRSAAPRKYRKIWMQEGSPLAVYSQRLADKIGDRLQAAWAIECASRSA